METRNLVFFAAGVALIVACCALAMGWMRVAEDAAAETQLCERKNRRRVAEIPRIVVGTHIVYQNEVLLPVDALRHEDSPTFKIDKLFERLEKDHHSTCDASQVCLDNLVVLVLDGEIESRIVNKIINTAWAAGFDLVASPQRNNTW